MQLSLLTDTSRGGQTVYVLARLAAEPRPSGERGPVNLALVLDRSSSMRGPRIAQAIRAAREVVGELDHRDRLAIISFDATARTVFGPANVTDEVKPQIEASLDELRTGVGTNIAAGIKKGAEAIRSGFVRGAASRLVLLTDGQPSVGITDPARLGAIADKEYQRGVTITAMGLGESFDDELLSEIASRGRGGFHYLADAADISAAFGRELAGVFAIAATQTEMKLLPADDVLSVEVVHRLPSRPLDDGLLVELGEVAAGPPRQVLFRLVRLPGADDTRCGTLAVSYKNPDGSAGDGHIVGIEVPQVPLGAHAHVVTLERLRLAVASAVDTAWARRASGDSPNALAALGRVKARVLEVRAEKRAPPEELDELLSDIAAAEDAVARSSAERERVRKSMREKSHITLLGRSTVRSLPEEDE